MLTIAEEAYKTDPGKQRQANEDSYFVRAPVFVVADGMGGARAGEVAAQLATEAFEPQLEDGPPEEQLRKVVQGANRRIHELAQEDISRAGMGTTLTAVLVSEAEVSLAHVGDSRAYLFHEGELRRLTRDHSLVEELVRQGRLTDEEAESHPQRSVITRALGPEANVEVDTMTLPARDGDVFLLCSDGLTTMVGEDRIGAALAEEDSLQAAVDRLVREANEEGGRDNITVVAFRVEETETRPATSPAERSREAGPDVVEGRAEQDQDTLTGAESEAVAVKTEDVLEAAGPPRDMTMIMRPGEVPAPEAPPSGVSAPRRRPSRRAVGWLIAAVVVGLLVAGAVYGLRQIYFVGSDRHGVVALYRGLPYELPLGVHLYQEHYSSAVAVASLPPARRRRLLDHTLRSHSDAADIIRRLEAREGIRE